MMPCWTNPWFDRVSTIFQKGGGGWAVLTLFSPKDFTIDAIIFQDQPWREVNNKCSFWKLCSEWKCMLTENSCRRWWAHDILHTNVKHLASCYVLAAGNGLMHFDGPASVCFRSFTVRPSVKIVLAPSVCCLLHSSWMWTIWNLHIIFVLNLLQGLSVHVDILMQALS